MAFQGTIPSNLGSGPCNNLNGTHEAPGHICICTSPKVIEKDWPSAFDMYCFDSSMMKTPAQWYRRQLLSPDQVPQNAKPGLPTAEGRENLQIDLGDLIISVVSVANFMSANQVTRLRNNFGVSLQNGAEVLFHC